MQFHFQTSILAQTSETIFNNINVSFRISMGPCMSECFKYTMAF